MLIWTKILGVRKSSGEVAKIVHKHSTWVNVLSTSGYGTKLQNSICLFYQICVGLFQWFETVKTWDSSNAISWHFIDLDLNQILKNYLIDY